MLCRTEQTVIRLVGYVFLAVLLCWVTQDFELYAAFDPLADKVFFFSLPTTFRKS